MRGVTKVGLERSTPRGAALSRGRSGASAGAPEQASVPGKLRALLGGPGPERPPGDGPTPQEPTPTPPDRGESRRAPWRRAPALIVAMLGGGAAVLFGGTLLTVIGAAVLVAVAIFCGWLLGEDRRQVLQLEVDERNDDLRRALSELEIAQAETVAAASRRWLVEVSRARDTGAHIERIGRFSTLLAEAIGMSPEFCRRIGHAAPLHDVGKVAIPDAILLKPGPLTAEERTIVETHAEEGHRLLRGSSSSILDMGATIALSHHERWDGDGYPRGLAAENIPIEGRIVAIADVFDALTSHRIYRKAFSVEKAVEMMLDQADCHFDPVLLHKFMEVLDSSGAEARTRERSDPSTLIAGALEIYTDAMRLGDAELAEEAIAQAIEDGIEPATLKQEVIGPAMSRVSELRRAGELGLETEQRADSITRRVTATMDRYMLARG